MSLSSHPAHAPESSGTPPPLTPPLAALPVSPPPPPEGAPCPPPLPALLDRHRASLHSRSAALDLRAHELCLSEAALSRTRATLHSRAHALARLETTARAELADVLQAVAARQEALHALERAQKVRVHAWKRAVERVEGVVREGETVWKEVRRKREELERVGREVEQVRAEVGKMKEMVTEVEERRGEVERGWREVEDEKGEVGRMREVVRGAMERMEEMEREVRRKQEEVTEREREMERREEAVRGVEVCARVLEPLRRFVGEVVHGVGGEEAVVEMGVVEVVERAVLAVRELRVEVREVRERRGEVARSEAGLMERERVLEREKAEVRGREGAVEVAEGRLGRREEDVREREAEMEGGWLRMEEARKEWERREEVVRGRERAVGEMERRMKRRAKGVEESERVVEKRERSLRRALRAVVERESVVETREREVEMERVGLRSLGEVMEKKEGWLETRDFELKTRETVGRKKGMKRGYRRKREEDTESTSQSVSTPGGKSTGRGPGRAQDENQDRNVEAPAESEQADGPWKGVGEGAKQAAGTGGGGAAVEPATVRRQLAFESTALRDAIDTRNDRPIDAPAREATSATVGDDGDDESEVAATEMLPELLGMRDVWKERITRLEAVTDKMQTDSVTLKPQLIPVLEKASANLRAIREDIEGSPQRSFPSAKQSFAAEQTRQKQWGAQMRKQLDAMDAVQVGIMVAINREEDAAVTGVPLAAEESEESEESGGTQVRSHGMSEQDEYFEEESSLPTRSTSTSSYKTTERNLYEFADESTVDLTLDATERVEQPPNPFDITEDSPGDIASSFQNFRLRMQAYRNEGTTRSREVRQFVLTTEGDYVPKPKDGRATDFRRQQQTTTLITSTSPKSSSGDLLEQLTSLRNDLAAIPTYNPPTPLSNPTLLP